MAKAREPKVFRSMDDLPLMLTPYDLMDFLGKGQRQTYELIHSEGLKACTVMEVASAVPIVQNVVISAVVKTAVEQAKAQEKDQEQRNGILGSFTKTLCN